MKLQQQGKTLGLKSDADGKKREADDDQAGPNKKTKKKKTVRWKTGDELAKVKLIEWMEPEGEYYGGGSGHENHEWGNARNFDVEEGREALAALKNRNLIEEEEDLLDWYTPKGKRESFFIYILKLQLRTRVFCVATCDPVPSFTRLP